MASVPIKVFLKLALNIKYVWVNALVQRLIL